MRYTTFRKVSDPYECINREDLDYFLHAICETCCDCVPMGSIVKLFASRKQINSRIKVDRVSALVHAHAALCKVWPNALTFSKKGRDIDIYLMMFHLCASGSGNG